jgi:hypothetical protein
MKLKSIGVLLLSGASWVATPLNCFAAEPAKPPKPPVQEPKNIKTNFVAGVNLLPSELKLVVALAKQCGITNVAEVNTFHYQPGGGKGISVKSAERLEGRNTSYDSIEVHRIGWNSDVPTADEVRRDGNFWCEPKWKYTTLLRNYVFKKQTVKVEIGQGVDVPLADKIVALFEEKRVRIDNDFTRREFDELWKTKLEGLFQNDSKKGYELRFEGYPIRSLLLEFQNGQLVVTGVMHTVI